MKILALMSVLKLGLDVLVVMMDLLKEGVGGHIHRRM
jgi:hypothetical protein